MALQLKLGWSHEYADVSRPVAATLAGAPALPFTTYRISPARDGVLLGLGADTAIADRRPGQHTGHHRGLAHDVVTARRVALSPGARP